MVPQRLHVPREHPLLDRPQRPPEGRLQETVQHVHVHDALEPRRRRPLPSHRQEQARIQHVRRRRLQPVGVRLRLVVVLLRAHLVLDRQQEVRRRHQQVHPVLRLDRPHLHAEVDLPTHRDRPRRQPPLQPLPPAVPRLQPVDQLPQETRRHVRRRDGVHQPTQEVRVRVLRALAPEDAQDVASREREIATQHLELRSPQDPLQARLPRRMEPREELREPLRRPPALVHRHADAEEVLHARAAEGLREGRQARRQGGRLLARPLDRASKRGENGGHGRWRIPKVATTLPGAEVRGVDAPLGDLPPPRRHL